MLMNLKPYLCSDPGQEFDSAAQFANLRLGEKRLFWKSGLRRYAVELASVCRVWRQEENVYGKLCCGGRSYVIHRLVLKLEDGKELTLHIGDDAKTEAAELVQTITERFPHIAVGKE